MLNILYFIKNNFYSTILQVKLLVCYMECHDGTLYFPGSFYSNSNNKCVWWAKDGTAGPSSYAAFTLCELEMAGPAQLYNTLEYWEVKMERLDLTICSRSNNCKQDNFITVYNLMKCSSYNENIVFTVSILQVGNCQSFSESNDIISHFWEQKTEYISSVFNSLSSVTLISFSVIPFPFHKFHLKSSHRAEPNQFKFQLVNQMEASSKKKIVQFCPALTCTHCVCAQ